MAETDFRRGRASADQLVNRTRGTVIASEVRLATSPWARGLGLMGHPGLTPGQALVLRPENSVHMFFMRFPLDLLFLDKDGKVLHIYHGLKPWRVSRFVRGSKQVAELPPGALERSMTQVGDTVAFEAR